VTQLVNGQTDLTSVLPSLGFFPLASFDSKKYTNNILNYRVSLNKWRIKEKLIKESMRTHESYAQLQQTINYFFTLPDTDEIIVKWTPLKAVFRY
jgi:hypothetical protein